MSRTSLFSTKEMWDLAILHRLPTLNAMTILESYPVPRIDECTDSLGTACVFSTLDCNNGYWQIEINEKDRQKTGFVTHHGLLQFIRMPLGLRNAPGTFQLPIDIILSICKWNFSMVYLDEIIIFSNNVDNIDHITLVLTLLGQAGMTIRLKKCFMKKRIEYLGQII